jgi:hypothetical protein
VATVVQPLKDLYGDRFEVAPYAVLFKPSRGAHILEVLPAGGFSPKAAYIFRKQLEEADAIVLNRLDELDPEEARALSARVEQAFPGTPVLRLSARTGQGFELLTELLDQQGDFGRKVLDIDYDTYAEGEAELGWLNSSASVRADRPFALDELLLAVVTGLGERLRGLGAEVAHLKVIGLAEEPFGVTNLVASGLRPELSVPARAAVKELDLIVKARVAVDPAALEESVRAAVAGACAERGARADFRTMQSFRPGRPTPTHRYAQAR